MPLDALVLALLAALVHAAWNVLVADAEDPQAVAALGVGVGVVVLAVPAAFVWDVEAEAVPYVAASAALHLVYFALLTLGYARADLGLVYPVARGSAPVFVLIGALLVLRERPAAAEVAGVLLVVAGIFAVRGVPKTADRGGVALALATGAGIAAYTVVDDRGVEHAHPIPYLLLVLLPMAITLLTFHTRRHGRARLAAMFDRRVALSGAGMVTAYVLALVALERAAAAPVAAVRETSVLMALGIAAAAGTERVTPLRVAGAALVVAGVAALALA